MTTLFKDLTIVELAGVLAGPSVGMFFAELGARVIKIENPKRPDVTRSWKIASEDKISKISAYFSSINYLKEYISLDLTVETDFSRLIELIKTADILISNFKKGSADRLHLSDQELNKINPKLIHGKISGFGSNSARVAYDLIVQAESGFMSINGEATGLPTKMPVALIDVLTAHQLKEGLLCALVDRISTGKGRVVEVSLYETAVCSLVNQASTYLMESKVPERMGSKHPSIAPYGEIFETKDRLHLTFAIGTQQHFERLMEFLNLGEYILDERFANNQKRVENRTELEEIIQGKICKIESNKIMKWALNDGIPCGKIRKLDEVLTSQGVQPLIREEKIAGKDTKRITSIAFKLN